MKYAVRQKFAQHQARAAKVRRRLRVLAGAAVLMITGAMAVPAVAPTVFKVRPGDTFSGIASKLTGKPRDWNKLYDPQRSQLPDPDYILPGMRFQLVSEADGSRYLRLATPAQLAQAKAEHNKRLAANKAADRPADKPAEKPADKAVAAAKQPVVPVLPQAPPLAAAKSPALALPTPPATTVTAVVAPTKPANVLPVAAPPVVAAPAANPVVAAAKPLPVPVPVPVPVPMAAPGNSANAVAKSGVTPVPLPVTTQTVAPASVSAPAPAPLPPPSAVGLAAAKPGQASPSNGAVPVPLPAGLTPIPPAKSAAAEVAVPAKTAALSVAAAAPTPLSAGGDTLVIGVMPNLSAGLVAAQYNNLKTYLERSTAQNVAQKVRVVVPANMKAYFEAMVRGDYDLAIGSPHFARLAQVDARLVPVAMFEPRTNAQFVTLLDGPMKSTRDLQGKAVVFSNPQSLVAMYGRQWLSQQSLEQGKDYDVKSARTDLGVGRMLLSGDAVAAVMSSGEFRTLPADEAARLKIVEVIARIPNFVVMAHPRLGAERVARLKPKLQGFLADKNEGAAFAKLTGVSGIVDVDEGVLRELDPFVAATRRMMVPAP